MPASGLMRSDGTIPANTDAPTHALRWVRSYMTNGTPMLCMNVPAFETNAATKYAVKFALRSASPTVASAVVGWSCASMGAP